VKNSARPLLPSDSGGATRGADAIARDYVALLRRGRGIKNTHLPMDNFGANGVGGNVSCQHRGLSVGSGGGKRSRFDQQPRARSLIEATLTEVQGMKTIRRLLYQWL